LKPMTNDRMTNDEASPSLRNSTFVIRHSSFSQEANIAAS
jgi:hypothetical protein